MLYTSRPLEEIYRSDKEQRERKEGEYMEIPIQHGTVMLKKEGKDYIVEKTISTDFSDYLKEEYMPGSRIKVDFPEL